jgi:hypothetical protein
MKVSGAVDLELVAPRDPDDIAADATTNILRVTVFVIPNLFRPLLLGRNVLDTLASLRSHVYVPFTRDSAGAPAPRAQEDRLRQDFLGVPAKAAAAVSSSFFPRQSDTGELFTTAAMWFPSDSVQGVEEISGFFDRADTSRMATSAALVTAVRDRSPAGCLKGAGGSMQRFILPVSVCFRAPTDQNVLIPKGTLMGFFHPGPPTFPSVHPSPAPTVGAATAGRVPEELQAVEEVIARTIATSPLLTSEADKVAARHAISSFQMAEELPEAGQARGVVFEIRLKPGSSPFARRNYRLSLEEEAFAEEQIRKWLANGTIIPSRSAWASPIVIARHPRTGKLRFCIDYRSLNSMTIRDAYLMPLIRDISRSIQGCKVFSKVDATQGFNQIPVAAESQDKTAFRGPRFGLYQFAGTGFGPTNVPATFQRFMDLALGDLLWLRAAVYMDDIIVFSKSLDDHHRDLADVSAALNRANVWIKPSKASFYLREVEFLGCVFNGTTIRAIKIRVQDVLNCAPPKSCKELQSFLGVVGQFRPFIYHFADLTAPLEAMKFKAELLDLSEGSPGHAAWRALRQALADIPDLTLPDFNLPFTGWFDASAHAISMVVTQEQDGRIVPIAFCSKILAPHQLKWTIPRKECEALRHFLSAGGDGHIYFSTPGPHKVYVDSLASNALTRQSLADPVLIRCAQDIQDLNIEVERIPGNRNLAHAFTQPPFAPRPSEEVYKEVSNNPLRDLPGWQEAVCIGDLAEAEEAQAPSAAPIIAPFTPPVENDELTAHQPNAPIGDLFSDLPRLQSADAEISRLMEVAGSVKNGRVPSDRLSSHMVLIDDILYHFSPGASTRSPTFQPVIPEPLRQQLLLYAHEGPDPLVHASRGGLQMYDFLLPHVWWSSLRQDCLRFACDTCLIAKRSTSRPSGYLHASSAQRFGERMSLDLVPMPEDIHGYSGFALLSDRFSGALFAVPFQGKPDSARAFELLSACRGSIAVDVKTLVVDQDPVLTSQEFKALCSAEGIEVRPVTTNHQNANFVERSVKTVKETLRASLMTFPVNLWRAMLRQLTRSFNLSPSSSRGGYSPYFILTGWQPPPAFRDYPVHFDHLAAVDPPTLFSRRFQLQAATAQLLEAAAAKQVAYANKRRNPSPFQAGNVVYFAEPRERPGEGNFNLSQPHNPNPFTIEHVINKDTFCIRAFENGEILTRVAHSSDLRRAHDPSPADDEYFVVSKILNRRDMPNPDDNSASREYLVQWTGHDASRNTWEPSSRLAQDVPQLVANFDALYNKALAETDSFDRPIVSQPILPEDDEDEDEDAVLVGSDDDFVLDSDDDDSY